MPRRNRNVEPRKIVRESRKRSNAIIAREVIAGKYGDDWQYAVRKMGYSTLAVGILIDAYRREKGD